jgi:4-hydroxybenzoate polyprenyltransferase
LPLLRLVHPFPSAVNAVLVFAVASVAGGSFERCVQLALAMLGLQFCIGAVNDLYDEALDAQAKPWKPIPAGVVSRRTGWIVAFITGVGGLLLAALVSPPDPLPLLMAAAMLSAGLVYDVKLKPTAFGWVCFAIAFPILPLYAWYGAVGTLPPRWEVLVPVAALAGLALQLANGLVDLEEDLVGGIRTFVGVLGRRRSIALMAAALLLIHGLAWLTTLPDAPIGAALMSGVAGSLALGGVVATAQEQVFLRQVGWTAQTISIALLAISWLVAAAG